MKIEKMAYIALELKYISKSNFDGIYNLSVEISKLLSGLIKTL